MIGVVCYWLFTFGGPGNAPNHFDKVISFLEGSYVGRDAIADVYPDFERVFLADVDNDNGDLWVEEEFQPD